MNRAIPPILVVHQPTDAYAAEIVRAALVRLFTSAQVRSVNYGEISQPPTAAVLINPTDDAKQLVLASLAGCRKLIALGRLGSEVAKEMGLSASNDASWNEAWGDARIDPTTHHDESRLGVKYASWRGSPIRYRPFCRYDFADEWNNLGYGRITTDGGQWSVAMQAQPIAAKPLAWITLDCDSHVSIYASILETPTGSALWFNRPVGPVDSLEWRLIEAFLGDYRAEELPCIPYLSEIPAGYDGAVTMRLDCDEAVASVRRMLDLYSSKEFPLSLALPTGLKLSQRDHELLRDVIDSGGSVVPHSVNHLPNWGGSYDTALQEAVQSKQWLHNNLPKARPIRFAVSPFHQNPSYAVRALADAGYEGFVAGIIRNDPEYLLGRAGRVPFVDKPILSHSQQCMFHGDCFRRYGCSISPYIEAFHNHLTAQAIFGCLDHPFSERYQYGWESEHQRLEAHAEFLHDLKDHNLWRCNLNDCLAFLKKRDNAQVRVNDAGRLECTGLNADDLPSLAVRWKSLTFTFD